ncbi:hypothetical protein VQ03_20105 [Methylobacterium tarhaniae]|uniref:Uncharacterized protein n=1 Tax=Methylobacterium tarhaniae TaxID=1187852 RepID=A0A0J6STG5_9HYPH|nr:hypothetical protein [Methylobacterium tarhaniae]KMO36862.1 hypothetical protein VQ03_20105 [Methylobacterium tarhaniae]
MRKEQRLGTWSGASASGTVASSSSLTHSISSVVIIATKSGVVSAAEALSRTRSAKQLARDE